jgi:type I restriction enzyme M protein
MITANIGFEETLWKAADKLRGSMDSGEYKHVVLGLISRRLFLVIILTFMI